MRIAVERALPHGALAPWYMEPAEFADFHDFDAVDETFSSMVATRPEHVEAMRSYTAVVGHFSLPTLLGLTEPAAIATVLREPRARLLSLFAYWRITAGLAERVAPYDAPLQARRPLEDFLAEPRMAGEIDNKLCRLLLFGDDRLPDTGFIAEHDVAALADAALERLDELGFVGFVERDAEAWEGVGNVFGLRLERLRENVTGDAGVVADALPVPRWDAERVLDLLEQRCAVDALIYGRLLARRCGSEREARRVADAAFAAQLVRLGDATGTAAAAVAAPDEYVDGLRRQIAERDREIERLHGAVAERDRETTRLHAAVADRDATVAWLHSEVAARDRRIAELSADGRGSVSDC